MWSRVILLCVFGCTSSLTTSFDLGGVISGNRMAGVPLGKTLGDGVIDVEGICTQTGMACQNCSLAVTCIKLPIGWLKVPLLQCPEGKTCNAHEGKCSTNPVPECDIITQKYHYTCEQVGIFPDAYDCRKFHLCSPPDDMPDGRPADHRAALCPRHYGYNPQTAQCSVKLLNGQCSETPVPLCQTLGQISGLPSSPNHYYVCFMKHGAMFPQIFICPHGWYFWDGFCRPEPKETVNVPEKNEDSASSEADLESATPKKDTSITNTSTETPTTSKIESFFSTEKSTTYAADTFLADKFDLTNYESTDDLAPPEVDFDNDNNSFEDHFNF